MRQEDGMFSRLTQGMRGYFTHTDNPDEIRGILASRVHIWVLSLILLTLVLWACFFQLDTASRSEGEVVPATLTKPVQHLEGGIVNDILVLEGQRVEAGQPLVELQRIASDADLGVVEKRIRALEIKALRIQAQLDGRQSIEVPEDYPQEDRRQVNNANQILAAAFERFASAQDRLSGLISQRQAELRELQSRQSHLSQKLLLLREQIRINDSLMEDGLVTKFEQLNLLKEEESLAGSIAEINAAKQSAEAAIFSAQSELDSMRSAQVEELETELSDTNIELEELRDQRLKLTDTQQRLMVVAPAAGMVLNLNVLGPGAVVRPGGTLMNLVPVDDPLMVETRLPVGDIGLVEIGQNARLELMSGTARGFQPINGEVVSVSADRVMDEDGNPFYRVRVRPEAYAFARGAQSFRLVPGVRVQVSILVGSRSVASYLLEPFKSVSKNALIEP